MLEFKKIGFVLIFLLLALSTISATLEIKKEAISSVAIKDLGKPAIFNLEIFNDGEGDSFTIYSFVGVDLRPNESVFIGNGETKTLRLEAYPSSSLGISPDYYSFEYKIIGAKTETQKDELAIMIVNLKDAFNFYVDPINPDSESIKVHFDNKYGGNLDNIHLELSSEFFSQVSDFSLEANQEKIIEIPINKDKIRALLAGQYILDAKITAEGLTDSTTTIIEFQERSGIETKESKEGLIIRRQNLEKINNGNVKTLVETTIQRNLFSSLFTSVSPSYSDKSLSGFTVSYIFNKEISPGESLNVIAVTNWWILIGIIVVVIILLYIIDEYIRNKIVMKKTVSFVRTKGGEFALRINLKIKARDFVERVKIFDRLPPMVKVFDKFGMLPDRIDEANRRLEWNIQALAKGEERTLSYIIYSKIGVMGKFELPQAEAIYEFEGKIKEASSNRAFYSNENK